MELRTWKSERRSRGYDTEMRMDCACDKGLETAWKQVTECINNGIRPEDVEKMVKKLTTKPDAWDHEHLRRVGLRAAERYCLAKWLTGETEDEAHTSGRWDPLKKAITKEFLEDFSLSEVYGKLREYFITFTSIHAQMKNDIGCWIHYGPALAKYTSDMNRAEFLEAARSKENLYWSPAHLEKIKNAEADFEKAVSEANTAKFKITPKDQERVDVLVAWGSKGQDKARQQAEKIGNVDKAISRFALGLKSGVKYPDFRIKAHELGATEAEIEALCRKIAGKNVYHIDPETLKVRPN